MVVNNATHMVYAVGNIPQSHAAIVAHLVVAIDIAALHILSAAEELRYAALILILFKKLKNILDHRFRLEK